MTRGKIITLFEFYQELKKHDWYYEMSDDSITWRRGKENANRLYKMTRMSPEHKSLFEQYYEYMFSGEPWGTERAPEPKEPANTKSKHVLMHNNTQKKIVFIIDVGFNRAEVTYTTNTPVGEMIFYIDVEQARERYRKALKDGYVKVE
jgi:hypothetical protein